MDIFKEMNDMWDEIRNQDQKAKTKGTLIGRYVSYFFADGYAFYKVVSIDGPMVTLDHIPYGDAWRYPMIEEMDCEIPLKVVRKNIKERDNIEKLFNIDKEGKPARV